MKLTARIGREEPNLVKTLIERGIKAKLVRMATIVEIPNKDQAAVPGIYEIPEELLQCDNVTLLIDLPEEGGGYTNTGSGTVVCGLTGRALHPYYVVGNGHRACGEHAYFAVPHEVVTVTGYRRQDTVTILRLRIVRNDNTACIDCDKLWSGELGDLPDTFSQFRVAAEAAVAKGNCYHCREVHFSATKE